MQLIICKVEVSCSFGAEILFVDIPEGIHKLRVRHSKLVSATRIFEARNNSEKVIEIHTSKFKNYFAASLFGFGGTILLTLYKESESFQLMLPILVVLSIYVIYKIIMASKKMLKIIEVDLELDKS